MSFDESGYYYSIHQLMECIANKMDIKSDVKVFTSWVYANDFAYNGVISSILVNGEIQSIYFFCNGPGTKYLQIPKATPNNFKLYVSLHEVIIQPDKKTFLLTDNTVISYYDYEVNSL